MVAKFLLKWLGVTTLKAAAKYLATKFIVKPGVDRLGDEFQKMINDPGTDLDEDFVKQFKLFSEYAILKRLNKI